MVLMAKARSHRDGGRSSFFAARRARGWIYCLVNPSLPGLVKIGFTTGPVETRMAQLDGTATPEPFRLMGKWRSANVAVDERRIHRALAKYRVRHNREFFALEGKDARHKISSILDRPTHAARARRQRNGLAQAFLFVLALVNLIWLWV
ncbi:MAG: GIY-YIG nuclease family protein [Pseudomonadota bacterium]